MSMDRKIEKKKGLKKKHIFWISGGAILVFLIIKIILSDGSSAYRTSLDELTVETVKYDLFNDYISVTGHVEPINTIYLDAIEGGRVTESLIEEGEMVKQGDIILKLENKQLYQTILNSEAALAEKENYLRSTKISFESELIQSRKNILSSEYRMTRKKRQYDQYKALYEDSLISGEEYLQAKEDYEYESELLEINRLKARNDSLIRVTSMMTLDTDLTKMREMLKLVRERLDNLNVKAPVDGQLGMLNAEIGQSVSQGQRIGLIHVLTDYKIHIAIDEHYIDRVKRGLSASFERNNETYNLTIRKVYPEVRDGKFEVDLVFNGEKPDNIRTGQSYHVKLQLGMSEEAILLPRGAFFQNTGGQWIFVLDEQGKEAVRRDISIGKQNPKYFEVLSGLEPGERVITSSYRSFGDNERIIFKKN